MAATAFTRAWIRQQLGEQRAALLFRIAEAAAARATERAAGQALYLVGGAVRDGLLLRQGVNLPGGRSERELDLMLAGGPAGEAAGESLTSAIAFARALQAEHGGELRAHARFGTAQWRAPGMAMPDIAIQEIAVDFACARQERYPRPGQLPQARPGSAEQDLWRRDFSINALAIQLSPPAAFGRLLDPCGGQRDLERGLLRALHRASFRDDPTRFLRGLRLAARLNLRWEAQTVDWARASLPILARLSGSRLRAEFTLLFREKRPEDALAAPAAAGLLARLHPAFITDSATLRARFAATRAASLNAPIIADPVATGWRLLTMGSEPTAVAALAARFTLRKAERAGLRRAAELYALRHTLADESRPPAQFAAALADADDATRRALWVLGDGPLRRQLARYEADWRQRRPALTGRDLRRLGLPPGPRYRELLRQLQIARWNGEVRSEEEERELLARLLIQFDRER